MLSYLHGFHAGNHADVLKHTVLTATLARLVAKDKPLRYIDTHAGAGSYDLHAPAARRNHEHDRGIGKIWESTAAPPAVARLLELVHRHNTGEALRLYPGSPWLARELLRPDDRLHLFELHPVEHRALARNSNHDRRVKVRREDGLVGCLGLVPPPEKRGLVLIDPSYELQNEHRLVLDAVVKAHRRFATGVIAIWYPVIERRWVERFERAVRATRIAPIALYELCVAEVSRDGGLVGSGMVVINPPWQLHDDLAVALPWLAETLGVDGGGTHRALADLA